MYCDYILSILYPLLALSSGSNHVFTVVLDSSIPKSSNFHAFYRSRAPQLVSNWVLFRFSVSILSDTWNISLHSLNDSMQFQTNLEPILYELSAALISAGYLTYNWNMMFSCDNFSRYKNGHLFRNIPLEI